MWFIAVNGSGGAQGPGGLYVCECGGGGVDIFSGAEIPTKFRQEKGAQT